MFSYLDIVYDLEKTILNKYGREPGRKINSYITKLFDNNCISEDDARRLCNKVDNYCKKLTMVHYASIQARAELREFESTENMEFPCLIWEYETKVLYHLEAMILLARSALDLAAYVCSNLLINKRNDSFNSFIRTIDKINSSTKQAEAIKNYFNTLNNSEFSAFRLLCGAEKGRALRDIVVHQTTLNIEYLETKPNSEKESCHIIVNKTAIPFEIFIDMICRGVMDIIFFLEDIISEKSI